MRTAVTAAANAAATLTLGAALAVGAYTHDAPKAGYVAGPIDRAALADRPSALPTWTTATAAAFPACAPQLTAGQVPARVVAVNLSGDVAAYPFDVAWDRNHTPDRADDLWIVGACA